MYNKKDRKIEQLESLVEKLRTEIRELKTIPKEYVVHSDGEIYKVVADEVYRNEGANFFLGGHEVAYFNKISSYVVIKDAPKR